LSTRQYSENGARVFANLGLNQTWQLNKKWSLDGGLDHSRTVKDDGSVWQIEQEAFVSIRIELLVEGNTWDIPTVVEFQSEIVIVLPKKGDSMVPNRLACLESDPCRGSSRRYRAFQNAGEASVY